MHDTTNLGGSLQYKSEYYDNTLYQEKLENSRKYLQREVGLTEYVGKQPFRCAIKKGVCNTESLPKLYAS